VAAKGWMPDHMLELVFFVSLSTFTPMIGWQERQLAHKNPVPLIHRGPLPEEVEKEDPWEGPGNPYSVPDLTTALTFLSFNCWLKQSLTTQ